MIACTYSDCSTTPEFAGKVYDTLTPGATIIVTDQPAVRKASRDFTILAD